MATLSFTPDIAATEDAHDRASRVKLMIFDVDGVFTDGSLLLHRRRRRHEVVQLARRPRRETAAIGRRANGHHHRAQLGHRRGAGEANWASRTCHQGVADKTIAFAELLRAHRHLRPTECGYMGDDWPDLAVMRLCGFAAAPANAHPEVIAARASG